MFVCIYVLYILTINDICVHINMKLYKRVSRNIAKNICLA